MLFYLVNQIGFELRKITWNWCFRRNILLISAYPFSSKLNETKCNKMKLIRDQNKILTQDKMKKPQYQ